MKVSVACEGRNVSGHFGHCEGFKVYDVEGRQITSEGFIQNPGHKPGFLPEFLRESGVDVIVAGGMGGRAQDLFNENNIEVIVGVQGSCDEAINKYLENKLVSTGSVCHAHEHEGDCGE